MVVPSPDLRQLASQYGVATAYQNNDGEQVEVSAETLVAVLASMDVDASRPEAVQAALARRADDRWRSVLPPCVVMRPWLERTVDVHVPEGHEITVTAVLEDGTEIVAQQWDNWEPPRVVDGIELGEATFRVPPGLPLGYHRLRADWDGNTHTVPLVITPAQVPLPERSWGIMAQLYSARSAGSWGIGDITDLRTMVEWGAEQQAGFVLTNPMHAAEPTVPQEASPYLPTSRRFSHPIYLRVEDLPEYADLSAADKDRVEALRQSILDDGRTADRIDRDVVWPTKIEALRIVHAQPRTAEREEAYTQYRLEQEEGLIHFAWWMAMAEDMGSDWRLWPEELQGFHDDAVRAWAQDHHREVEFQMWLQWQLDEQLATCQAEAIERGMAVGIMADLAVGVNQFGAETWANPELYARGATVGAPPDAYNQLGQNWAQPPMRPDKLAEQGYAPFRALVGTLLRHAGGLRIDHIMALFRLWWIPEGAEPTEGTYVYYDHEAMVGVLALEAQRVGATIVGEDLGTVEPYVRDYLRERGLLGTSILWWEKNHQGQPLEPWYYRDAALSSVTTHDMPPTAGYLEMDHIALRDDLDLFTRPVADELADERREQESFLRACIGHGFLPGDFDLTPGLEPGAHVDQETFAAHVDPRAQREAVVALHRYLAATPSRMLCAALTDMVGDKRIQNQPGTSTERPNWRIPLSGPDREPILLEDGLAGDLAHEIAAVLRG